MYSEFCSENDLYFEHCEIEQNYVEDKVRFVICSNKHFVYHCVNTIVDSSIQSKGIQSLYITKLLFSHVHNNCITSMYTATCIYVLPYT